MTETDYRFLLDYTKVQPLVEFILYNWINENIYLIEYSKSNQLVTKIVIQF
jgi:hypothetical protein